MRFIFLCILLLILVAAAPVVFTVVAMQPAPMVQKSATVTSGDAKLAESVMKRFRNGFAAPNEQRKIQVSEREIDSLIRFGARAVPGFRARVDVESRRIVMAASAKPPRIPMEKWLNLSVVVAPSDQGLNVIAIQVGDYALPPELVISTLTAAMNLALGDNLGSIALQSVEQVAVRGKTVAMDFNISKETQMAILASSKNRLREALSFGDGDSVRQYYVAIHEAAASRRLPSRGSFAPYLHFAFDMARQRAAGSVNGAKATTAEMRSALLALGVYCGVGKLENLVGGVVPAHLRDQRKHCGGTTLAGRGDLRQHFIVSAVLQMTSDFGVAFTIGEFKELLDSNKGGSGFSFDDVAGDLAGIRFVDTLFADQGATTVPPKLLAKMKREATFFPSINGLPSGMSEATFKRRFSKVDSPAYKAMVAKIERRIQNLAFHAG